MKKSLLLTVLVLLCACRSAQNDPSRAAKRFLEAYYDNEFEEAIRYAETETAEELQHTLGQLEIEGITFAERKLSAQKVIIEIEGIVANDGHQAVCAYKIKNSRNDANAMIETLLLTNTDTGWKVSF